MTDGTALGGRHLVDRILAAGEAGGAVERRFIRNAWRLDETADNVLDGSRLGPRRSGVGLAFPTRSCRTHRGPGEDPSLEPDRGRMVRGPCVIGANVVIRHAYIGPYTSVGDGLPGGECRARALADLERCDSSGNRLAARAQPRRSPRTSLARLPGSESGASPGRRRRTHFGELGRATPSASRSNFFPTFSAVTARFPR